MDERFKMIVEQLRPKLDQLIASAPVKPRHRWPNVKLSGVYLWSDGGRHLYVGRSRNIKRRYHEHRRNSVVSAFADILAKQALGFTGGTYREGEGSSKWLGSHPPFLAARLVAKKSIQGMEFRFVEEPDDVRQCILEVYAAVVLSTPHNAFRTH